MATIEVEATTLDQGTGVFTSEKNSVIMSKGSTEKHPWRGETDNFARDVEHVELLDEGKVLTLMNTAGFSIAAVALLGPLGAIVGLLVEGDNREIAFCRLPQRWPEILGDYRHPVLERYQHGATTVALPLPCPVIKNNLWH